MKDRQFSYLYFYCYSPSFLVKGHGKDLGHIHSSVGRAERSPSTADGVEGRIVLAGVLATYDCFSQRHGILGNVIMIGQ